MFILRLLPDKARQGQTRETLSTVGSQSGSLPFQISANTAIHRSIFLPVLILKRIYSLSNYTWSSFRSSRLVRYGTYVRISTHTLVVTVSSHARIQTTSFTCSTAGSTIKEYSSTYYSDETIVGLCICAKGLIQVRATSFSLVYLYAVPL